jgi:hypothetical protein
VVLRAGNVPDWPPPAHRISQVIVADTGKLAFSSSALLFRYV